MIPITNRLNCLAVAAATAFAAAAPAAGADAFPSHPIRMIVPISPGGATDTMARIVTRELTQQLGVNVIVDNRPGAGTVIGTEQLLKSPPDGYTLMTVAAEYVINPSIRKLPYDTVRDLTCVTQIAASQYFLSTHPTVPVGTTRQFIALAKGRPNQITFASSGNGSANHLAGILFQHMTGTKLVHVPYKGAGPARVALLSGEIDFMFSNIASAINDVKQGKLRAIASTGPRRSPVAPDVPTISESGVPGFVVVGFGVVAAPSAIPADILARVNAASVKAIRSDAARDRLLKLGLEPVASSSAECNGFLQSEIRKWAPVVKAAGMHPD
jgi:tripartite-type tricarboxylate transporter receptor subunit TctC